jgi:iron complex outermembrane receptor protein
MVRALPLGIRSFKRHLFQEARKGDFMKVTLWNLLGIFWTLLAVLGTTPAALAEQTDSRAAVSETGQLDEVVVTAQKRAERIQDVPFSITALSSEDLKRANLTTATDLPSLVSGLVWSGAGAFVQPNLRGLYSPADAVGTESPIAIYLDGVYQPVMGGTLAQLPDVSQIEVLKGPQGTLFGRNALGAVSVSTYDPSFTPEGKFSLLGGVYSGGSSETSGHFRGTAFLSGPLIDDALAGSISAYYDTTDGYFHDEVRDARGGHITDEGARGKLLWKISDGVTLLSTAYYSRRIDGAGEAGLPLGGVTSAALYPGVILPTQPWHLAYNGPAPEIDTINKGASLKATIEFGGGTLTSISAYSQTNLHIFLDVAGAYSPPCVAVFSCVYANLYAPQNAYSQEFDFASKQMGPFRYVAGLFGFYDDAKSTNYYNGFLNDLGDSKNISYAAFAEGTYNITDKLSAVAGVRVTRDILKASDLLVFAPPAVQYVDTHWTSATPRASLIYKINPVVNTYFTYSQGFKAGIVGGTASSGPPASPEKVSGYELGVKAAQQNYSLSAAAFLYEVTDLQVTVFDTQTLANAVQNAAKERIVGFELDGDYKFENGLEFRVNPSFIPTAKYTSFPNAIAYLPPLGPFGLTTNNDYDATGTRALTTPRFTGTLTGIYTRSFAAGNLTVNASIYHSSSYTWGYSGLFNTDAYNLINAQVSFSQAATNLKYSLYGKNLNNAAYVQSTLLSAGSYGAFFNAPREIGLRLDYSF